MEKLNKYIVSFNRLVSDVIKDTTFNKFFNEVHEIILNCPYDFDELSNNLDEYKEVLDKVISIIYKPHIKIESSPVILRSEQVGSLDIESFKDTIRDTKLWKEKNPNEYIPEEVHSYETVDSIVNYENKFIVLLVNKISNEFDILKDSLSFFNDSLEENYQTKSVNYTKRSIFEEFKLGKAPYDTFFNYETEEVLALKNKIQRISRLIKSIKGTEFYRFNNKKPLTDKNVLPTNVLTHDPLYAYCYKYYKMNMFKEDDNVTLGVFYYNYIVLNFIYYLRKSNDLKVEFERRYLRKINTDEGIKLTFDPIDAKTDIFDIKISTLPDKLALEIEVSLIKDSNITNAKYLLLTIPTFKEENYQAINNMIHEYHSIYDSIVVFTMNNAVKHYRNVMNVSIYTNLEDKKVMFDNLFKSFTFLFYISSLTYVHQCPVCGEESIYFNQNEYECLKCDAKYSIFEQDDHKLLWIKSLRRNNQ